MDVDSSEPSVIDVSDFLPEFRRFRRGVMKMNPPHQTTHVKVHPGPHARRSRAGKTLIDAAVVCIVLIFREYACVGRCVAICGATRPRA